MINKEQMAKVMKERGFSLQAIGGGNCYIYTTDDITPSIACDIYVKEETFQLRHITERGLQLQTGMCGSLFLDDHFNRHLRNMINYIANGD